MVFLTLLIFPFLIALFFKLATHSSHKITTKEFVLHCSAQLLIAGINVGILYWTNVSDVEIWNGRIVEKEKDRVSCSHSYQCNCRSVCSGTGKSKSCSTVCDTCYEHLFDYDWKLHTSNKEIIRIDRANRQGTKMPPRFAQAKIGDPTAITHYYENFVKAAPDSLFAKHGLVEEFKHKLIEYPNKVYNYHYVDRALGNLTNKKTWNGKLAGLNADIGKKKQANVILVSTSEKDPRFARALEQYWLGGKKNDIVVVFHSEDDSIVWTYVFDWAQDDMVNIKIRDDLKGKPVKPDIVLSTIRKNVIKYYKRKPMKDFEYLAHSVKPSGTQWIISMLFGLFASVGLGIVFWKYDIFNEE